MGVEDARPPGDRTTRPASRRPPGPLGQGVGNAVGMALAERMLAARYNRPGHEIVDHYTYTICSDGDLQEGVSGEASSIAGHLQPRPPDVLLRRQPHHDRGRHRPVVHRGRGRALRAATAGTCCASTTPGRSTRCATPSRRRARRSAAEHDHPAHPHRARRAEQAGHRQARTASRSASDEIRLTKLAYGWPEDDRLPGARTRCASTATAAPRARRSRRPGRSASRRTAQRIPTSRRSSSARWRARRPTDFADRHAVLHRPDDGAMATRAAGGKVLQASPRWCPSWSAARPTWRRRPAR